MHGDCVGHLVRGGNIITTSTFVVEERFFRKSEAVLAAVDKTTITTSTFVVEGRFFRKSEAVLAAVAKTTITTSTFVVPEGGLHHDGVVAEHRTI